MRKLWDYMVTAAILLIIIAAMVFVSAQKKPEPMTELYFADYKNLPEYSNGDIDFSFAIHNMEGKEADYNVEVAVENKGTKSIVDGFTATLEDGEKKIFPQKFSLDDFRKARIVISLKNKGESIYFWTNYAGEILKYEGIGIGVLDCLPTAKAKQASRITITAKADYAKGWPIISLYIDGKKVKDMEVSSEAYRGYVTNYSLTKGTHVIDVMFSNDFYDSETMEDRNVYIGNMKIGSETISLSDTILNTGKGSSAINCVNTEKEGIMYGNGAIRFKLEVE